MDAHRDRPGSRSPPGAQRAACCDASATPGAPCSGRWCWGHRAPRVPPSCVCTGGPCSWELVVPTPHPPSSGPTGRLQVPPQGTPVSVGHPAAAWAGAGGRQAVLLGRCDGAIGFLEDAVTHGSVGVAVPVTGVPSVCSGPLRSCPGGCRGLHVLTPLVGPPSPATVGSGCWDKGAWPGRSNCRGGVPCTYVWEPGMDLCACLHLPGGPSRILLSELGLSGLPPGVLGRVPGPRAPSVGPASAASFALPPGPREHPLQNTLADEHLSPRPKAGPWGSCCHGFWQWTQGLRGPRLGLPSMDCVPRGVLLTWGGGGGGPAAAPAQRAARGGEPGLGSQVPERPPTPLLGMLLPGA